MTSQAPERRRLAAVLRQRCPRCLSGALFEGWVRPRSDCSSCGLRFAREPGYWVGAMYLSYAMAVPLIAAIALLVRLARPGWSWGSILVTAPILTIPLAPFLYRYARTIWLHLDRLIDPE